MRSGGPGSGAPSAPGEVLGAQAGSENPSGPRIAGAGLLGGGSNSSLLAGALLGMSGLALLVGLAGGLRALHGRLRTDSRFP